jgi:protein-disulfide isomerase
MRRGLILLSIIGTLVMWHLHAAHADEALTPDQKKAVEEVIRQYLVAHPEVVRDALIELQRQQEQAQQAAHQGAIAELHSYVDSISEDFVQGNPKAETTVVEFFDYRCPYCKAVAPRVDEVVADDKGLRIVLMEFPVLGPDSVFASRAAIASRAQGKYMAFHKSMMSHKGNLDQDTVLELAKEVGLDLDRLKADMQSPEVEALIKRHYELADKLGVTGTPAFVIGEELVPGAIDVQTMKAKIKQARQS